MKERLDKTVASCANVTRSEAKQLIKSGAVSVNGSAVTDCTYKFDSDADMLTVSGQKIGSDKYVYIMLHKPQGVVSASRDDKLPTVVDILPDELKRKNLFPAGRLDKDTTGFCLITDDGEFAHDILSPSHHVEKTYLARVSDPIDAENAAKKFEEGIVLADGTVLLSAKLELAEEGKHPLFKVVIREGRYHQVKRMFSSLGTEVIALHRTAIGGLVLDDALKPGEAKLLSKEEISRIKGF